MKGILKKLSPFAPDQSGEVAVLYELGGFIVICDAGGCTGNICGFDEPRWFYKKSAICSAGLRDMDAILGRDDKLVEKLANAVEGRDFAFAAVVGTPVPAVIGTDFQAVKRMIEKRTGMKALAVEATGVELYDKGEEKSYAALFDAFATERYAQEDGVLGVIGVTPLDFSSLKAAEQMKRVLGEEGWREVVCYGMDSTLEDVERASRAEKNLVVAPAGIRAAKLLKERFGTPYEVRCPWPWDGSQPMWDVKGKKVLVMHQQVMANAVREYCEALGADEVTVATWFMLKKEIAREGDVTLNEENALAELIAREGYDVVIGDEKFRRVVGEFRGEFIDLMHFAVSGRFEK